MNYKDKRKAFEDILSKVKEILLEEDSYFLRELARELESMIFAYDLNEKYGLNISEKQIVSNKSIHLEKYRGDIYIRSRVHVLNSMVQPKEAEMLMEFSFPTGGYIFGGNYDMDLFNVFFEELKTYKYKYIDEINKSLYFDLKEGSDLYKDYEKIYDKYRKLYIKKDKERRKKELLEELERMEEND